MHKILRIPIVKRAESDMEELENCMNYITFFKEKGLLNINIRELSSCMKIEKIPAGTNVLIEGDVGDRFYFIMSGEVEIYIPVEN